MDIKLMISVFDDENIKEIKARLKQVHRGKLNRATVTLIAFKTKHGANLNPIRKSTQRHDHHKLSKMPKKAFI